jgi:hypothetical protein
MRNTISKCAHVIAWLVAVLTTLATACWVFVIAHRDGWGGLLFVFVGFWIVCGALLLSIVPSGVLYFQGRERRDRRSLWLAGCSLVALLVEIFVLFCVPLHGG